jgi:hypothetical protein
MKLYSFFRSGTSHRLRLVPQLTGRQAGCVPIDRRADARSILHNGPRIQAIDTACAAVDAFCLAAPAMQPDAT